MAKRRELLRTTILAGAGLFGLRPEHRAAKAASPCMNGVALLRREI